jgi:Aldo/keto reductase family
VDSELEAALEQALTTGYRHIDTAFVYENEHVVGKVLKKWLDSGKVKREDLFIVTKVSNCYKIFLNAKIQYFKIVSCQKLETGLKASTNTSKSRWQNCNWTMWICTWCTCPFLTWSEGMKFTPKRRTAPC